MTIKEAVTSVLSNYATFSGRARRSEYWYFTLCVSLVSSVLGILASATGGDNGGYNLFTALSSLFSLAVFLPSLAVISRRLHDIGKSAANYFWVLVPVIGWVLLLVWLCRDSQPGDNQYGPNPKEVRYY